MATVYNSFLKARTWKQLYVILDAGGVFTTFSTSAGNIHYYSFQIFKIFVSDWLSIPEGR